MTLISGGMLYIQECPLKRIVHSWTFILHIFVCSLSDHEYSYSQATPSFWLCVLILGYAIRIFHTTDIKCVMFRIG